MAITGLPEAGTPRLSVFLETKSLGFLLSF